MGNSNSEETITYNVVKKQKHRILGQFQSVQVSFGPKLQLCTLKRRNDFDIQLTNKQIQRTIARQNNHAWKHLFKKIYAQQGNTNHYCTNLKSQQIFYEPFEQDLQLQYFNKRTEGTPFREEEILKVLRDCASGLRVCGESEVKVYHISKESILKNKAGAYMLILEQDADRPHPLYEYVTEFNSQLLAKNSCISPQLLLNIETGVFGVVKTKDHIFSLGATLLSICLMKEMLFESEIVGIKSQQGQKRFHFAEIAIKKQVYKLKKLISSINYSNKLKFLLQGMLEFDEQKRFSLDKIMTILGQSEQINHQSQKPKQRKIGGRKMSHSYDRSSKQNLQTIDTHKTIKHDIPSSESKKVLDVYLDAKHLFYQNKVTIADNAKNYKNAKMGKLKLENFYMKSAVSKIISSRATSRDVSPIKKLRPYDFNKGHMLGKECFVPSDLQLPFAQSQFICGKTIKNQTSKTSIMLNILNERGLPDNSNKYQQK